MRDKIFGIILILVLFNSCEEKKKDKKESEQPNESITWIFKNKIELDGISPVGLAFDGETLWLADTDNNRLVQIDTGGNVLDQIPNVQRPMHIEYADNKLHFSEFLIDTILYFEEGKKIQIPFNSQFDAPAGVSVNGSTMAVADFYNHRVVLKEADRETIIGKKGHGTGELFYPTDVKLYQDRIYVADAYNNRVQVFDKKGNSLLIIGKKEKIRVASGIEVARDRLFVTDFERNRVLVYSLEGKLEQVLSGPFDQPSDVCLYQDLLFVANYGGGAITIFEVE